MLIWRLVAYKLIFIIVSLLHTNFPLALLLSQRHDQFLDNHQYWSINDSQTFDRGVSFPFIGSLRVSLYNYYFDNQKIANLWRTDISLVVNNKIKWTMEPLVRTPG